MLVELYTRKNCHLCEVAKAALDRARVAEPFELRVVDVDSDEDLVRRFGLEVPVIFVAGRKHAKFRLDERAFVERLRSAAREPLEAEESSKGESP